MNYFNEDLEISKPTGIIGIPRIYTHLFDKINYEINKLSCSTRFIAKKAIKAKLENLASNGEL